jgi:hypothetical protein
MEPMNNSIHEMRRQSPAFLRALLESERLRIRIVLAAIVAAFAVRTLRTALLFSRANLNLWAVTSVFIGIFAIYELLMLRAVNRSIQDGLDLPNAVWMANIVIESCFPALALLFLSSGSIEAAYKPLANPAVFLYFIFIILSTLRLDPMVSRISGIVAGLSYLVSSAYLGWVQNWVAGLRYSLRSAP